MRRRPRSRGPSPMAVMVALAIVGGIAFLVLREARARQLPDSIPSKAPDEVVDYVDGTSLGPDPLPKMENPSKYKELYAGKGVDAGVLYGRWFSAYVRATTARELANQMPDDNLVVREMGAGYVKSYLLNAQLAEYWRARLYRHLDSAQH